MVRRRLAIPATGLTGRSSTKPKPASGYFLSRGERIKTLQPTIGLFSESNLPCGQNGLRKASVKS
jgi:hypothetical protein